MLSFVALTLAAPEFSVPRGLLDAPVDVALSPSEPGSRVLWSMGTAEPTTEYTAPISVMWNTTIRAREVYADGHSEDSFSSYFFVDQVLNAPVMDPNYAADPVRAAEMAASLRSLPIVSLVVPDGLDLEERAASLEWIDPEGSSTQVGCGARIVGGTSHVYEKNSVRLSFRSTYGPGRLELSLFDDQEPGFAPADHHDMLTLRSGNHDTISYLGARGQHLRNYWMDETQLEMGHLAPHGRFVHVFRDTEYWGVYHLRERFNAAFFAEYLGGKEEDYEAINGGTAFDGDGSAWAGLLGSLDDYAEVGRRLDRANFLDYMVLNFYAANAWDWLYYHNWIAAGPRLPDRGGFRFHSSDSDICLYYDASTNILSNTGPSNLFGDLWARQDPAFLVDLTDAIYRNLRDGGPLDPGVAAARYEKLSFELEQALVIESARWGQGWWDRDEEWATERDWLLGTWFPARRDVLWAQMREAGWYPVDAPRLSHEPGVVDAGTEVGITAPADTELWVTTGGGDPRDSSGEPADFAQGPEASQTRRIDEGTWIKARTRRGELWGPLAEAVYEVDKTPPLLLNEWNAVAADQKLDRDGDGRAGEDAAWGRVPGNGGAWIELLVLDEDLDVRGWTLSMRDRSGEAGQVVLGDVAPLGALSAGTIFTVSTTLPEDTAYNPAAGDWRFHLRATEEPGGAARAAAPFRVTAHDWQLTIQDREGRIRFGPAGEGVAPQQGLSDEEVGIYADDPGPDTRREDNAYRDSVWSTYGAPNRWEDGEQDLRPLREGATTQDLVEDAPSPPEMAVEAGGCSCASAPSRAHVAFAGLGAALAVLRRRRRRE